MVYSSLRVLAAVGAGMALSPAGAQAGAEPGWCTGTGNRTG